MEDVEVQRARAALAAIELRRERARQVQALFGEQSGICDTCQAVAADLAAHQQWHQENKPTVYLDRSDPNY